MLNRTVLTGRLTKEPELRATQGGTKVLPFTLAVDRQFRNKDGEREADFIQCVIWRKSAENFAKFTHKGSLIGVQGRIQTRTYDDKDGKRVYVTEVVVEDFALLESRNASENGASAAQNAQHSVQGQSRGNYANRQQNVSQRQQTPNTSARTTPPDPFANNEQLNISDAELPF